MKKHKIIILSIFILCTITFSCSTIYLIKNNRQQNEDSKNIENTNIDDIKNAVQEFETIKESIDENKEVLTNEPEDKSNINIENNDEKVVEVETNKSKLESNNMNDNTNKELDNSNNNKVEEQLPSLSEKEPEQEIKTKQVCTENDAEYKKWLNNFLNTNKSTLVFDTQSEAKEYGEYASENFGYGYWYSSTPKTYSDENCTKSIWDVRLYVGVTACTDTNGNYSKMMYINATPKENLISIFEYLEKQGYDCHGKKW